MAYKNWSYTDLHQKLNTLLRLQKECDCQRFFSPKYYSRWKTIGRIQLAMFRLVSPK